MVHVADLSMLSKMSNAVIIEHPLQQCVGIITHTHLAQVDLNRTMFDQHQNLKHTSLWAFRHDNHADKIVARMMTSVVSVVYGVSLRESR